MTAMEHLEMLLTRIVEDRGIAWTRQWVQELVDPDVSADTCDRLLRRLGRMGVLVPAEGGSRDRPPGGSRGMGNPRAARGDTHAVVAPGCGGQRPAGHVRVSRPGSNPRASHDERARIS